MNKANTLNKILLGAGIVSMIYLNGCNPKPNEVRAKEDVVKTEVDSITNKTYVHFNNIPLESEKLIWNNTKLVAKDEGFIACRFGSGEANRGLTYVYSEYLFRNPLGEEVVLFGREGTTFVGENYNIEFYKLKPDTKITSRMIFEALEDTSKWVDLNKYVDKDLEGVLNKYTRVTKNQELTK
jgi:hypothetical protein